MKLTNEQLKKYKEDGFLIIENFCSDEEIDKVTNEMKKLIDEYDPSETISIFTTSEQDRNTDDYFIGSSDTIRFFFEKDALVDGKLAVPKEIAFNKVGHALHNLNPTFEEFSYSPKIHDLIYSLGYKKALSVQSMYIFKNQRIGGEVNIHQDSTFLHTTPLTTHAIWFAFEDSTIENGCLRGLAGSHKAGITKRFIKNDENKFVFVQDSPDPVCKKEDFVALECKKGSIILLDGAVLHYSEPNKSQKSRHAYTLHFIEGEDGVVYEENNWLQSSKPFRAL
ncbi:hypothetical protein DICPUDRAFT_74901 [Dictyostelium purpureum]|uniref:Phytanoyl-CoA dioxygenase n=1 Tax=Dictyostelium purpureum TaxID=5786 RepID=F0Z926_DICPU|nr:uncharacterized protein DICPUDRAFT_74901 [Dictyostelium purpureum]EGC39556.1 hypothetical protein DICPUDRAFT_74901 [Dictyostelium purpureum]|eukprot:XP_003283891.1 hypothetical protein DICPUDRAFT_74901 [Dictyostelium purpureum]